MGWFTKPRFEEAFITNWELPKKFCAIHNHASKAYYDGCEIGGRECLPIMASYGEAKEMGTTAYKLSHKRWEKENGSF